MNNRTAFDIVGALAILVSIAFIAGWTLNAIKLAAICCGRTGWLVLRAFGIVLPPLGAVLGFL